MQEAYIAAFLRLSSFRGDSKVLTWLTRIVVNQALAGRRSRLRDRAVVPFDERSETASDAGLGAITSAGESPESGTIREDMRRLLERRIDELSVAFRTVFMLHEVGDLSGEETGPVSRFQRRRLERASFAPEAC